MNYIQRKPQETDLYKIIVGSYRDVFSQKELDGVVLPFHLKREFFKYSKCGVLSEGFARFHCPYCQKDKLVPFSCKGRTLCPSCNGRRMSDTAKHLIEKVFPTEPIRQWVLTMPYQHRLLLASNKKLLTKILSIYHGVISKFYLKKAKKLELSSAKIGGIAVIQRFGSALNLNIHFHSVYLDGVFYKDNETKLKFKEIRPTNEDVENLVQKIKEKINSYLEKKGFLNNDDAISEMDDDLNLILIKNESVLGKVDGTKRPIQVGRYLNPKFVEFRGDKCFYLEGFSLNAKVRIGKYERDAQEKLFCYILRGAIPQERISRRDDGAVILKLKKPFNDGTTLIVFTPAQFIKRIIALIPPPRSNLIRYLGVLGARSKNRKDVIPVNDNNENSEDVVKKTKYWTPWSELLKYVFKFDVSCCEFCGTKLILVSTIKSLEICRKILDHLKIDYGGCDLISSRGPPSEREDFVESSRIIYDIQFNQENNW